jgi:Na+-driven multidrug efflux pump
MLIPGIWCMTQFDAIRKFMIAQRQNSFPVYVQTVTVCLHLVLCHYFIILLEAGVIGAALASNITYLMNLILIEILIWKHPNFEKTRSSPF